MMRNSPKEILLGTVFSPVELYLMLTLKNGFRKTFKGVLKNFP